MAAAKFLALFFILALVFLLNQGDCSCQRSFNCGNLGALEFPLALQPHCGLFMVDNCSSEFPRIQLGGGGSWYHVVRKLSTNMFLIRDYVRHQYLSTGSCDSFTNVSIPQSDSVTTVAIFSNITLYTCSNESYSEAIDRRFENYRNYSCSSFTVYYRDPAISGDENSINGLSECSLIQVPRNLAADRSGELFPLLSSEFNVEWTVSEECSD